MSNRIKSLFTNVLVYGLNRVIVSLIPIIMLPIISRLMPDVSYFGLASIVVTISTLGTHLASFGMNDSAMRFAFDKDNLEYRKKIASTSLFFMIFTNVIMLLIFIIFNKYISSFFFASDKYRVLVIIASIITVTNSLMYAFSVPTRIKNNRVIFIFSSIGSSLLNYFSILFFIRLKYFEVAIPLGMLAGTFFSMLVFFIIERKWFKIEYVDTRLIRPLVRMGAPLVLSYIGFWIYQSTDKIMLAHLSTLHELGIYSVGAKLATIGALLYTAFNTGWSHFAFSTMNDQDQKKMMSRIFEFICILSVIIMLASVIVSKPLFNLFFNNDYVYGYNVAPLLLTAPLFQLIMQVAATQLIIKKKTVMYSAIQILGATVNILINFPLVFYFGAKGAAIATFISYLLPTTFLVAFLWYKKELYIKRKFVLLIPMSLFGFAATSIYIINYSWLMSTVVCIILVFIIIITYKNQLSEGVKLMLSKAKPEQEKTILRRTENK